MVLTFSDDLSKPQILHAEDDFLIMWKPAGLPSAPLKSDSESSESALEFAVKLFPEAGLVAGKKTCEGGLVHRIDTATAGILLIARTQSFFDYIQAEQKADRFEKEYAALCTVSPEKRIQGAPEVLPAFQTGKTFEVRSLFRSFGKGGTMVRPVFEQCSAADRKKAGTVEYCTSVRLSDTGKKGFVQADCSITRGFRHQVRAHLSSCGFPVYGDLLYGAENPAADSESAIKENMAFYAVAFSFFSPEGTKKHYSVEKSFLNSAIR